MQRVLKFAKYLPEFGWQPIVLTVNEGEYPAVDQTLIKDIPEVCKVFKSRSFEPNLLYKRFVGMKAQEQIPIAVLTEKELTWKKRIANWVRLNFFIPDAKITWKPAAVRLGKKIILQEKPDLILSSSPPVTVHLIAQKLSRWSGLKWIADFRDPWTDIYHYDMIKKNRHTKYIENKMEGSVLNNSDDVITVSESLSKLLQKKIETGKTVKVIPNGYDHEDYISIDKNNKFSKFTIAYAGKLNSQQNPINLWNSLSNLIKKEPQFAKDFQLLFMGNFNKVVLDEIHKRRLTSYLQNKGYLAHHEMLSNLVKSNLLLLVIPDTAKNEGILTGKVFEYLAAQNYIIAIGPKEGDTAKLLRETGCGKMFDFQENLESEILRQYQNWKKAAPDIMDSAKIQNYSREKLTEKLVSIFDKYV